MTDFPRGWTRSVDVGGAAASIVVPAVAGVAHVLDAVWAKFVSSTAGSNGANVTLTSSDGTFAGFTLARLNTPAAAAGSLEVDSASLSELGLVAVQGASLTVAFTAGGAGTIETLVIQGHDI